MKKYLIIALAIGFFQAAGPDLSGAKELSLTVSSYGGELIEFAANQGYFSKNGLFVNIVTTGNPVGLVMQGRADACVGAVSVPVDLYLRGEDVVILAQLYSAHGFYGISRFPLAAAASIKTAVSGSKAGPHAKRLKAMLKYLGAGSAAVSYTTLSDSDRYKMLEDRKTDLILVNARPLLAKVRAEGKYHVIEPREAYKGKNFFTVVFSRSHAISSKEPELRYFIGGLYEALDKVRTDPQAFVGFLTKEAGFTPEEAAEKQREISQGSAETEFVPAKAVAEAAEFESDLPAANRKRKGAGGIVFRDFAEKSRKP